MSNDKKRLSRSNGSSRAGVVTIVAFILCFLLGLFVLDVYAKTADKALQNGGQVDLKMNVGDNSVTLSAKTQK
jgi:hypothetical protein